MNSLRRFAFASLLSVCLSIVVRGQALPDTIVPAVHLTFTTIDFPGSGLTAVEGINSTGDMVGWYAASNSAPASGFLLSLGTFTSFAYPGGHSTFPRGITDSGLIAGWADNDQDTGANGFLFDGINFTTVRAPGKSATMAFGINNAGIMVGGDGSLSSTKGFARVGTRFKDISPPGTYIYVFGSGINNHNWIVGTDDQGSFLYHGGQFQTIAVPGASMTQALGINDNGVIVGWYQKCSPLCALHGFVRWHGKYLSFDYPGANYTFGVGVNASGQVVGQYELPDMTYHGFVASPITTADFDKSTPAR